MSFTRYTLLCAVVVAVLLSSCSRQQRAKHKVEPIPVTVTVISETQESVSQNYVGTVEAVSSSVLSFAVPGNVTNVYVKNGQKVAQGTLLAEIDATSYNDSYAAAQATLRQAQDGYDRLKQLHDKGSITEVQWVEIQTKLEQAKSSEALARKNLENCKLYAPFAGVVGKTDIALGMNTLPGMSALTLLKTDQVEVRFPVPENVISDIRIGQPVRISVSALGNRVCEGRVGGKGVVANPLSHNYEVTVPVVNRTQDLMPGMVCNVQLASADSTRNIVLPNQTVKVAPDGEHYVWVVRNGRAVQRPVVTGGLAQKGIIVVSGLCAGDSVITRGEQKVSTGMEVVVQ